MLINRLDSINRIFDEAVSAGEKSLGLVVMSISTARNFQLMLGLAQIEAENMMAATLSPIAMAPGELPANVLRLRQPHAASRVAGTDGAA